MHVFLALVTTLLCASLPRLASAEELRVILSPEALRGGVLYKATGYWQPTLDDVERMESKLRGFLLQKIKDSSGYERDCVRRILENYLLERRQYVGLIVGGKRLLHANFIPKRTPPWGAPSYWKTHYDNFVDDGGPLFWRVNFLIEDSEFVDFDYNGEA